MALHFVLEPLFLSIYALSFALSIVSEAFYSPDLMWLQFPSTKGFFLATMYGKLHINEHVNSNPIGMGYLCSTLLPLAIHYKRCLCVDCRGVCAVFCRFSPSLSTSEGSDRVCQYLNWRGFTRFNEKIVAGCSSCGLCQSLALRDDRFCRKVVAKGLR